MTQKCFGALLNSNGKPVLKALKENSKLVCLLCVFMHMQ